jgi:opacity protein-like surface antigen
MKKVPLFILSAFLASPFAFAAGKTVSTTSPRYFNGFYVGAGLGISNLMSNDKVISRLGTLTDSEPENVRGISLQAFKTDEGKYAGTGSLFAGYGKTFKKNWYVGAEIFGRQNTALKLEVKHQEAFIVNDGESLLDFWINFDRGIKKTTSFGGQIKAGYLLSPQTLFYILAGAESSHIDIKETLAIPPSLVTGQPGFPAQTKTRETTRADWLFGIGLEGYFCQNWSLRTQYTHVRYHLLNYTNIYTWEPEPPSTTGYQVTEEHSDLLEQQVFSLDLIYHFD